MAFFLCQLNGDTVIIRANLVRRVTPSMAQVDFEPPQGSFLTGYAYPTARAVREELRARASQAAEIERQVRRDARSARDAVNASAEAEIAQAETQAMRATSELAAITAIESTLA